MAAKFKKGDRVRWTRTDRQYQTATVTENDTSMFDYRIEQDGDYTYAYEHELVPVAEATGKDAEPKFKVGDRVKFRDDYNSSARGTEATVVNVDSWGIMVDGVHGTSTEQPSSLRLVAEATSGKFNVGDRVRVHNHPYYLEEDEHTGTIISRSDQRGDWDVDLDNYDGADLSFRENELTPIPATLTIQAGKFYKTRAGRKVGPMLVWNKDSEWPWSDHADSGSGIWRGDGSVLDRREHDGDLIAEWADNPQPANDNSTAGFTIPLLDEEEPDTTLHIKFTSDFSELDAEIDRVKRRLKKLAKKARKLGISLEYDDGGLEDADSWRAA